MTDEQIWIGQNGKKYGPYNEANVRQWLGEGKFASDALAWRDGMAEWVPVTSMFSDTSASRPPQPPVPPPFANETPSEAWVTQHDDRDSLPMPPSLHWLLVWLFSILTLGIFGIIWPFIQANWVRKIDQNSNARLLLAIAFGCFLFGYILYFVGIAASLSGDAGLGGSGMTTLGGMLLLGYIVLMLVAYFSMAGSMRRQLPDYGLQPEIGGVTLFFFRAYYLQGQLSWVARWKATGQTTPRAPKGVFWAICLLLPFVFGILAAIAIPAYQDYVIRTEIAEGLTLADGAKTAVAEYYNNHGQLPADNPSAGLAQGSAMSGKYVSSVTVDNGSVIVAFHNLATNIRIRDEVLVLAPAQGSNEVLQWQCGGDGTTVPTKYLPQSCRQ